MSPPSPGSAKGVAAGAIVAVVLATLLPAGPALGEATPDALPVLHRYVEVTGGADAFAAESTAYAHASIEGFGFRGAFSAWTARPMRRYSHTELGPFQLREGVDGATAWRTDPTTGLVRPLADHDLDQALVGAWFELERWAEPDQGGGEVRRVGSERDSLGTYTVLEVMPPDLAGGGRALRARRLWFDDRTGLLVRIDGRDDQREVTTWLRDWRPGGLRRRAWVNETGVKDMPGNRLVGSGPRGRPDCRSSTGPGTCGCTPA